MLGGWSSTCTKLSHYTSWVVFADLFSIHLFIVTKIGGDRPRLYTLVGGLLAHSSSFLGWFHPLFLLWLVTERQAAAPFTIPSAIFFPPQHFMIMIFFVPNGFVKTWRVASAAGGYIIQPMCQTSSPLSARLRKIAGGRWNIYRRRRHNLQSIDPPPLYLNFLKVFLSLDFITPDG